MRYADTNNGGFPLARIALMVLAGIGLLTLMFWGWPRYGLYRKGLSGKAQLAEAEYNRQIAVLEAAASYESAKHLANAEIEKAKGVAEANRIIGASLKENHEYLMWLWIDGIQHSENQIIYVPTEGMLPVLEAGRLRAPLTGQ